MSSSCESPVKGKLTETSLHILSDTLAHNICCHWCIPCVHRCHGYDDLWHRPPERCWSVHHRASARCPNNRDERYRIHARPCGIVRRTPPKRRDTKAKQGSPPTGPRRSRARRSEERRVGKECMSRWA